MAERDTLDAGLLRGSRTRRVGLVAAGVSVATAALAAVPEIRGSREPWVVYATMLPPAVTYVCALLLWFGAAGSKLRFSLRNPVRRPAPARRIPARVETSFGLKGDGWIEFGDSSARLVGWTLHWSWLPFSGVLIAADLVRTFAWWEGRVTWIDFVLPALVGAQLSKLRTRLDFAPGDLVDATFLRGRVHIVRRSGERIELGIRESRAAELASELSRFGCVIHAPASAPKERPADLDATLKRLRETNDRLSAPSSR